MKPPKKNSKIQTLSEHIEKVSETRKPKSVDTVDSDLHSHIEKFVETWQDDIALPPIDLTTQEGARAASADLEEKFSLLQKRLKTARALKALAQSEE